MSTVFFPFLKDSGIGEKYPTILLAQDWKDNHPEDTVILDSRQLSYKIKINKIDGVHNGLDYSNPYWEKFDKIINAHYLQKSNVEGDHSILGVEVPKEYSVAHPEKFINYDHIANLARIIKSGKRIDIEIVDVNAKKVIEETILPQLIKEKAVLVQYRLETALNGMKRNTIKDRQQYINELNKLCVELIKDGHTVYTTGVKVTGNEKLKYMDGEFGFISDREDLSGTLMLKLWMLSKLPLVIGAASGYSLMIAFLRDPNMFPVLFSYCDKDEYVKGKLLNDRFPGYLANGGGMEGDLAMQGNQFAERFMMDVPQNVDHIMKFIKEFKETGMIKWE